MLPGLDSILGGGGLALGSAATGKFGPVAGPPVSVNIAGFGSKASGSATTAQVPDPEGVLSTGVASGGIDSTWLILGGVAVLAVLLMRG